MELVVLVIAGIVVYFVVTGVSRWWSGYRKRHNLLLQLVALTAVALVVLWASRSSTAARFADGWERYVEVDGPTALARFAGVLARDEVRVDRLVAASSTEPAAVRERLRAVLLARGSTASARVNWFTPAFALA